MADETSKTSTKPQAETKKASAPATKAQTATFNKDEAKTIKVTTAGKFQLFDPTSQITFKSGETVERPENDRFVEINLQRGKLKKA